MVVSQQRARVCAPSVCLRFCFVSSVSIRRALDCSQVRINIKDFIHTLCMGTLL